MQGMRPQTRQADVIQRCLDTDRLDIHVSMPGRVRSYDRSKQTAEIELLLREVVPSAEDETPDTVREYPILPNVPVAYFKVGTFAIHADLSQGDPVWVIFSEADFNAWRATGEISDPGLGERHGLSGAWCWPGAFAQSGTNPDASANPTIGKIGGPRLTWNGSTIEAGGSQDLALKNPTDAQLAAIVADLATIATALGTKQTGTSTPPTLTAAGVRSGNPIGSTVLKGA